MGLVAGHTQGGAAAHPQPHRDRRRRGPDLAALLRCGRDRGAEHHRVRGLPRGNRHLCVRPPLPLAGALAAAGGRGHSRPGRLGGSRVQFRSGGAGGLVHWLPDPVRGAGGHAPSPGGRLGPLPLPVVGRGAAGRRHRCGDREPDAKRLAGRRCDAAGARGSARSWAPGGQRRVAHPRRLRPDLRHRGKQRALGDRLVAPLDPQSRDRVGDPSRVHLRLHPRPFCGAAASRAGATEERSRRTSRTEPASRLPTTASSPSPAISACSASFSACCP